MRIAIITSGFASGERTERETYLRSLVESLQAVDRANEYTVYVEPKLADAFSISAPNFRTALLRSRAHIARRAVRRLLRRPRPGGHVPDPPMIAAIDRADYDVVHFPLQIINPFGGRYRKVVTFHEMQHEFFPELFIAEHLRARRQTYRPSAVAADHIVAVSMFLRQSLIDLYAIPTGRISVVHRGYDDRLFGVPARGRRLVAGPYFLYPAAPWPHKNHSRLLEGFARVRAHRPDVTLVLAGAAERSPGGDSVRAIVAGLRLTDSVIVLPALTDSETAAAYADAIAVVFPSLFEGFPTALCEAMACGCPVLASNSTSIPELVATAARLFDPMNPAEIADAMLWLVANPHERERLIAAGRERVRRFSALEMARNTLAVYDAVTRTPTTSLTE